MVGGVERVRKGDAGVKRRMGRGKAGENELKMPINYEHLLNIIHGPLINRFIAILLNINYLNIRWNLPQMKFGVGGEMLVVSHSIWP